MAPRKSVPTLEELCWETAIHHFPKLKYKAECLSRRFVDEFYKRLCATDTKNLPSKLFLHLRTTEILNLNFDLQPVTELMKTISRVCKNLRRIVLHHCSAPLESLTSVLVNNPLVIQLDLYGSHDFTDNHLLVISNHCPHLQYLRLKHMHNITDNCLINLPTKLTFLDINHSKITAKACVAALKRLKSLKELKYYYWSDIFRLLARQRNSKLTFSIERIEVGTVYALYDKFGTIIVNMFPKLCNIQLAEMTNCRHIKSLHEKQKLYLITRLYIFLAIGNVIPICKLCPMLEELDLQFSRFNGPIEIRDATQFDYIPFRQLRTLWMDTNSDNLQLNDFKFLLANFKWLKSLQIRGWEQLEDRVIDDILDENLLQTLERIELGRCGPFTLTALSKLVRSLDCLKFMAINQCKNISDSQYRNLENMIDFMNLDVNLSKCLETNDRL